MEKVLGRLAALALLLSLLCSPVVAQNNGSTTVRKQVMTLLNKHKNGKGVLSWSCDGGIGLQSVRLMLRKEFDRSFTDNITSFAIILYKDASTEKATQIVGDIARITSSLREIDIKDKMKKGEVAHGYVRLIEDGKKISDLLIVVEAPSPKLIYIGGEFDASHAQIMR